MSIVKLQVFFISGNSIKDFTNKAKNIDRCDNNASAGCNSQHAMERIGISKGTNKDGHFCNKAAEAWKTEICQTSYHVAYREERHNPHQTAHLTDITCMRAAIDHTDKGKEESCSQTVRKHLQDCTSSRYLIHHQNAEEHQAAVRH